MGLFLLNISVDTKDLNPKYIAEDLSINDQESIIELILEKVLGYEDAVKEYDDNDTEDHSKKTNFKIDLITQHIVDNNFNQFFNRIKQHNFPNYASYLKNTYLELDTPPPKI